MYALVSVAFGMYIFVVVSNWFFVHILLIKDSFCSIQGIQLVDMYLDNNGDQHKKYVSYMQC